MNFLLFYLIINIIVFAILQYMLNFGVKNQFNLHNFSIDLRFRAEP